MFFRQRKKKNGDETVSLTENPAFRISDRDISFQKLLFVKRNRPVLPFKFYSTADAALHRGATPFRPQATSHLCGTKRIMPTLYFYYSISFLQGQVFFYFFTEFSFFFLPCRTVSPAGLRQIFLRVFAFFQLFSKCSIFPLGFFVICTENFPFPSCFLLKIVV